MSAPDDHAEVVHQYASCPGSGPSPSVVESRRRAGLGICGTPGLPEERQGNGFGNCIWENLLVKEGSRGLLHDLMYPNRCNQGSQIELWLCQIRISSKMNLRLLYPKILDGTCQTVKSNHTRAHGFDSKPCHPNIPKYYLPATVHLPTNYSLSNAFPQLRRELLYCQTA